MHLLFIDIDLKVPSIPLQSSKAPVLCAANKSDARVHAAGFLRGPARAARPCCAVVPPLKQGARYYYICRVSSCLSTVRYKLRHMGSVTASPLGFLFRVVNPL